MTASIPLEQIPVRTGPAAHASIAHLVAAMREEQRLILDLIEIMRAQRGAVARDDLGAVDDSVFATHRMLVTLREAQHRRQNLAVVLCDGAVVSIHALDGHLGLRMTPALSDARDGLRVAAELLSGEVALNRRVLQSAMEANEGHMRAVSGAWPGGAGRGDGISYGGAVRRDTAERFATDGGSVLDRRI